MSGSESISSRASSTAFSGETATSASSRGICAEVRSAQPAVCHQALSATRASAGQRVEALGALELRARRGVSGVGRSVMFRTAAGG